MELDQDSGFPRLFLGKITGLGFWEPSTAAASKRLMGKELQGIILDHHPRPSTLLGN